MSPAEASSPRPIGAHRYDMVGLLLDAVEAPLAALDEAGEIVLTNRAWRDFTRLTPSPGGDSSEGTNYLAQCLAAADRGCAHALTSASGIRRVISGESPEFRMEYPRDTEHGLRWFQVQVRPMTDARPTAVVVCHYDVTDWIHSRKAMIQANEHLQRMAMFDTLTGTLNRGELMLRLLVETERAIRFHVPLSAMMIDVDHFKHINDRFGHIRGDAVLRTVVEVIRLSLREFDVLGRYGGEEFIVIMPLTSYESAMRVAHRCCDLGQTVVGGPGGQETKVTVTIGVASIGEEIIDVSSLLHAMDHSLYLGKSAGRNRVVGREGPWDPTSQPAVSADPGLRGPRAADSRTESRGTGFAGPTRSAEAGSLLTRPALPSPAAPTQVPDAFA